MPFGDIHVRGNQSHEAIKDKIQPRSRMLQTWSSMYNIGRGYQDMTLADFSAMGDRLHRREGTEYPPQHKIIPGDGFLNPARKELAV